MFINYNLNALRAVNQLKKNSDKIAKNTEKLASGYRINTAADDAAGLAISERMRSQINGLNQASNNIQDGVALIQTADGAMGEIQSMLQRMNTLAVQAANGTNTAIDRANIQSEVNQLTSEIDNIATSTQFNGIHLLGGANFNSNDPNIFLGFNKDGVMYTSGDGKSWTVQPSSAGNDISDVTWGDSGFVTVGHGGAISTSQDGINWDRQASPTTNLLLGVASNGQKYIGVGYDGDVVSSSDGVDWKLESTANTGNTSDLTNVIWTGSKFVANGFNSTIMTSDDGADWTVKYTGTYQTLRGLASNDGTIVSMGDDGLFLLSKDDGETWERHTIAGAGNFTDTTFDGTNFLATSATGIYKSSDGENWEKVIDGNFEPMHLSSNGQVDVAAGYKNSNTLANSIFTSIGGTDWTESFSETNTPITSIIWAGKTDNTVSIQTGDTEDDVVKFNIPDIKSNAIGIDNIDLSTSTGASDAMNKIKSAIDKVSTSRATLGAYQNRLEYAANNVQNYADNLTASEARIRDTDMASEVTDLTRNQILSQAGMAMLAQANALPQNILNLLK